MGFFVKASFLALARSLFCCTGFFANSSAGFGGERVLDSEVPSNSASSWSAAVRACMDLLAVVCTSGALSGDEAEVEGPDEGIAASKYV